MKTINKVLETMLSKPATPTWQTTATSAPGSAPSHFDGPLGSWAWGG